MQIAKLIKHRHKTFFYIALAWIVLSVNLLFSSSPLLAETGWGASSAPAETAQSGWSLLVENYPIHHHQGDHLLDITIHGSQPGTSNSEFPDMAIVYDEITQFLTHYSNETDYWEIVNRKLMSAILEAHPSLALVKVSLKVAPSSKQPYTRSTTVTHTNEGKILESWSFITAQLTVPRQGGRKLNITAEYLYRDDIANADYPDFVPIYQRIAQFLRTYPDDDAPWENVNLNLAGMVLKEYPMMKSFTSKLEVMPAQDSPYRYVSTLTLKQ